MDEPFVQGSYASGSGVSTETFDNIPVDPVSNTKSCAAVIPIQVGDLYPNCTILGPDNPSSEIYGASTDTGDPNVGGSASGFLTSWPGDGYSVNFSEPKKYVGFWWATASGGNKVLFYSGSAVVAEISIDGVNNLIGEAPAEDAYAADTRIVTSVGGTQYSNKYYFGNPRHYDQFLGAAPDSLPIGSGAARSEAFVYIHAFAGAGVEFDRVEFTTIRSGFEIDNLTTSTQPIDVDPRLVFIQNFATNATYSGIEPNSGSGTDWINLQGFQLSRGGATDPGYQTVYWMGRYLAGNWTDPMDLNASGGSIRNHSSDTSIDVRLPANSFTYITFWIDWCANLRDGPCVPLHYPADYRNIADVSYRYQVTRNLNYLASGTGTIQGAANQTVTYGGTGTTVTAIPDVGSEFVRWSDDTSYPPTIPASRTDVNITTNTTITAVFAVTPSSSPSAMTSPSPSPTSTETPTATPSATSTPSLTPTPTPTASASASVSATATPSASTPSSLNTRTELNTEDQIKIYELTGFVFEKSTINKFVKLNLKQIELKIQKPFFGTISCQGQTGFNWRKRSQKFLTKVANARAKNSCKYLKTRFPKAHFKILKSIASDSLLDETRKVNIFISN